MDFSTLPVLSMTQATIFQGENPVLSEVNFSVEQHEFVFLIGRTGSGKSSLLKQNFNFSLTLSQLELPDGNTRVLITPYDTFGNEIPKNLLSIPYVDGVDFIDIEPQLIPSPIKKRKRTGFGVMIGPSFGLNQFDGAFSDFV